MQILLTNDDGIYAPGLAALERVLLELGDVCLVAPATEQSGVGHSITFLSPLICKEIYDGNRLRGWAVEGSPADCVKLGVSEFCSRPPDLVVSGINNGLNAGINVLYSGTVAAAIEGAFFEITSIAVSLEYDDHARFPEAAELAKRVIQQIVAKKEAQQCLYNINIPGSALDNPRGMRVVPMDVVCFEEHYIKRKDPKGRDYYWTSGELCPADDQRETDLTALRNGFVTLTPLQYDLTNKKQLEQMRAWDFSLDRQL